MLAFILSLLKVVGGFLITPQGIAVGLGAVAVGYVLKRIDNTIVKGWILTPFNWLAFIVDKFFYGLGVAMTLGLSRWPITRRWWNKTLEPYFIDLLDNVINGIIDGVVKVINAMQAGLIRGLKSDNK